MDYALGDGDERCFRCGQDVSTCECTDEQREAWDDYAEWLNERRRRDEAAYFYTFLADEEEGRDA